MIHNLAEGIQAFTSNAFLVTGERTVLVDAGANFDVVAAIEDHVDRLDALVLTHTHPDHVGNADAVRDAFDVESWGFDPDQPSVDNAIDDEALVTLGDHDYRALHTPGHKDDHLCFYSEDHGRSADRGLRSEDVGVLFAGDLVFQNGAFGRTDLAEGDRQRLIESIERLLDVVDPSLGEMHVGHGPSVGRQPYEHIEMAAEAARRQ